MLADDVVIGFNRESPGLASTVSATLTENSNDIFFDVLIRVDDHVAVKYHGWYFLRLTPTVRTLNPHRLDLGDVFHLKVRIIHRLVEVDETET